MQTTNKFVFRSFGCLLFDIDCLKPCSGSIFGDEHADETRWLRDLFESLTVKMRIRLIHLLFTHLFPHCGLWAALIEQKANTTQHNTTNQKHYCNRNVIILIGPFHYEHWVFLYSNSTTFGNGFFHCSETFIQLTISPISCTLPREFSNIVLWP